MVLQRGGAIDFHAAGVAATSTRARPRINDHMRMASVAKAFGGAAALALVRTGVLTLRDTVAKWLPDLPVAWGRVTLAELLHHTSGIPDFSGSTAFRDALLASLLKAPPPVRLLSFVAGRGLEFRPGSRYRYSNSDNIVVGLLIEAATRRSYESVLRDTVYRPLGLLRTSLPTGAAMPVPMLHGYALESGHPPEDVTGQFAAGWTWASGGIVSTPRDANRFIRAYVRGATTNQATRAAQFRFIPGDSEPSGPGENAAGLAIFRYRTRCGTVYGHTGNTAGYTQFAAATGDGSRSTTVSVNAQITSKSNARRFPELRNVFTLAVCAALAR